MKFNQFRAVSFSLVISFGYLFLWYIYYPSTIDEFLLLTQHTQISNGFITKAEEIEDYVEIYDGRKTVKKLDFKFEYSFTTQNGDTVTSIGGEHGKLPDFLEDVHSNPFPVKIEYLPEQPEVNRIVAVWTSGVKSFQEWFLRKVLLGLAGFLFCCYLSFSFLKDAKEKYKKEVPKP